MATFRPPVAKVTRSQDSRRRLSQIPLILAFMRHFLGALAVFVILLTCAFPVNAQSTASSTVRGSVLHPSGAAIPKATVTLDTPVSHYTASAVTDSQGNFQINNVPLNNYHVTAAVPGFNVGAQDVDVRSIIPVDVKFSLAIGTSETTLNVTAGSDLVETVPTTHTDVDRALFDKLPLESASSELSSLVTLASPGIAADSNGLFHGLGDHAEILFPSMASRSPTSRARCFPIRSR